MASADALFDKLERGLARVPGAELERRTIGPVEEPAAPNEALRELGHGYLQGSFEEATKWNRPPETEDWNNTALWIAEGVGSSITPAQRQELLTYFDQLLLTEPSNEKLEALWESMKTDWYVEGPHGARTMFMLIRNRLEHPPNRTRQ